MRRPHLLLLIAATLLGTNSSSQAADGNQIATGRYELRLIIEDQANPENKDIRLPAKVVVDDAQVTIDTHGLAGNPVKLRGLQQSGTIKFGVTEPEDESLVTIIFTGAGMQDATAQGKLTILIDGDKKASGTWTLTSADKPR
ncbi:MAG: hypothetical protein KDA58_04130 [Planctomycetaceae bacterium]|nr:hypothetical protein [Planctomycetaceae bacterium]